MGLNARQKEAVEYLEGPLLVLAGPGTGKTQLLSEKVAYILQNTDTNPENILCLTFTETGAANMRERLKSIVGKDGLRVNIGTYHAFGQNILAQYRNYATNYDRNLDSSIDEVMQFKIVKEIRDALPGTDILHGDNVKDIVAVISDAKAAGLSAADLATIARQNIEDSSVLGEAISPILMELPARGKYPDTVDSVYRPIYEILKDFTSLKPILGRVERSIVGMARELEAAIHEADEVKKMKPLSAWKDKFFEKDENGKFRVRDRVANKKLASIARVMEKYQGVLKQEGLFDFDDMIQEAIRVLTEDKGFRLTLSERYQYLMLDEFQDTNPSQFKIVKLLTDYEKPVIMAVGDDDQAIYEFQGALATNLADFRDHYDAKVVALEENYRSTQEILDFSSAVIRQAEDRFVADKKLIAHKPAPKTSQIIRREFLSSDAEFGFVAREVADLVRSGVPQSKIAIISYKTKYFTPLLPFLKKYPEVKIAYDKRDNLLEDEQIHQILTIFRLISEVAEDERLSVSILEILAFPFFKLPMLEVIRVVGLARSEHQPIFETLLASDSEKVKGVAEFLADLVQKSFAEPLEAMMQRLVAAMKVDDLGEYEKFRFYENLAALMGKVRKHFGEKTVYVKDLVRLIDDYEEAEMILTAVSPYRDADEAVQILTAHRAKGLEFEYVFLISADHMAWGKGKGNNNLLALPKNLAQIRHTGTTDGEKLRILYVAMTRAESHLIITNSVHDFNGKSPERLEYFEESVRKDPETGIETVVSPFLPTGKVILDYDENTTGEVEDLKSWLAPYVEANPEMLAVYKDRVANYRMSATSLTSFIDIIYAGPQAFFEREILKAPFEAENEALALGNLVHAVFEAVTVRNISDEEAVQLYLEELEKKALDVSAKERLREKGATAIATSLNRFGTILRQGRAEVKLEREGITIEGVPILGRLDHIIIDEEAKTIEIYDFKTSKYHGGKWQSHPTLYKYMLQLGFYKLLLNNSPTYNKYTVTKGHILFVSPDNDGEVYDKVYEFNEADEKELISIIQAIYQQVITLNFKDDPEIFVKADKNKTLKDVKNFITLLLEKNE